MNRICWMIVFYLVMGTSILNAQTLIPEQNGKGKWGYVDLDGKKVIDLLLSDKPFYCKIKLGSIPFAGVDPFRLLWFRQKSKTTDAQK